MTSLAVNCTFVQKLPDSFSVLEKIMRTRLLQTAEPQMQIAPIGKYGNPMVVITTNAELRGDTVLVL